jgi:hypothetical protein
MRGIEPLCLAKALISANQGVRACSRCPRRCLRCHPWIVPTGTRSHRDCHSVDKIDTPQSGSRSHSETDLARCRRPRAGRAPPPGTPMCDLCQPVCRGRHAREGKPAYCSNAGRHRDKPINCYTAAYSDSQNVSGGWIANLRTLARSRASLGVTDVVEPDLPSPSWCVPAARRVQQGVLLLRFPAGPWVASAW